MQERRYRIIESATQTAEEYRDSDSARNKMTEGIQRLAETALQMARQDTRDVVERFGQLGVRRFNLAA